jgi:glycosyltransferase involved in cell wall biosynthesis
MQSTGKLPKLIVRGEITSDQAFDQKPVPAAGMLDQVSSLRRIRVLLDLKPALDGYAGIPQESRLLFRGLRTLPKFAVDGMIQHGSRILKAALSARGSRLTNAQRINRHSRTIVSLHERPYTNVFQALSGRLERSVTFASLWLKTMLGMRLQLRIFESGLFVDFLWRTLFSNTLDVGHKELVTSGRFRVFTWPKSLLYQVGLSGLRFTSRPAFPRVNTEDYDLLLAQTPFPGRVSRGTALVVRYHDAVPVLMPHVISNKAFHQASHFYSLQDNVAAGAWFCCVSEASRRDLIQIFPEAASRSAVIHNIVSDHYFDDASAKRVVFQIIPNRLGKVGEFTSPVQGIEVGFEGDFADGFQYLLMVSTIEPRKNHLLLLQAWERLKYTTLPKLKLVVVGSVGWDHAPILQAFRPWAERGELFYLSSVPSPELRVLYKHAAATICPSLAEGFDYTGIEAMRCGSIVISSDIPVHREVFEDASEYFSPYSAEDAALVVNHVLSEESSVLRTRMRRKGAEMSERYTAERILPQWDDFLERVSQAATEPR